MSSSERLVEYVSLGKGNWLAIDVTNGPEEAVSATGGNKRDARLNLDLRLAGRTPRNESPNLRLCKPCNKRAAEIGETRAAVEGVEVCLDCAVKIDVWTEEMKTWRKRQALRKARIRRKNKKRR